MRWHTTDDPEQFLTTAAGFLQSDPVANHMLVVISERLRRTDWTGRERPLLGWWQTRNGLRGAFSLTPGFPLAVTPMPDEALDQLADTLTPPLSGIGAQTIAAQRFARRWQDRTGATPRIHRSQRVYRLDQLTPPDRAPPGQARRAQPADRALLVAWHQAYLAELGSDSIPDVAAHVEDHLSYGGLVLWEADGRPTSMAGRTRVMAGICRVAPVYTPPHLRGRGYATAVTAEVSRHAIETGAPQVMLFTNPADATPNAIYQRIGYHPVEDRLVFTFT